MWFGSGARGAIITVNNLSATTNVTVYVQNLHTPNGAQRVAEVDRFGVGFGLCRDIIVEGWPFGQGGQLQFTNDSTGDAGGFTCEYEIRSF
jgi:hypothetical protein